MGSPEVNVDLLQFLVGRCHWLLSLDDLCLFTSDVGFANFVEVRAGVRDSQALSVMFGLGPDGSGLDSRSISSGSEASESLYIFAGS